MRSRKLILGIAAAAAAQASMVAAMSDGGPTGMAPARDGNVAIRQELELTRRTATVAAYDLFIARHPTHPLAEIARTERRKLARGLRRR